MTAPTLPIETQLEDVIRTLTILTASYEGESPTDLHAPSYTAGFRNGARSAYADAVTRIREALVGVA